MHVLWRVVDEADGRKLHLNWEETGGPPVAAPATKGFGSLLIQVTGEADSRIDFKPEGVRCLLELSL